MDGSVWDRAITYLGFRPVTADQIVVPRTRFERLGTPGPDSSPAELVIGIVFLVVLLVAWAAIALSGMNITVRILAVLAIVFDVAMIVARLRVLTSAR